MKTNIVKKEYLPTNKPNTFLKCELYYSLGGLNYFTYKTEPRGYYASVSPVTREDLGNGCIMEGYASFTGIKRFLIECQRKGKGAEAKALEVYEQNKQELLQRFTEYLEGVA